MCTAYGRLYRTVGVVWVCRRFDYSPFCRRFGVADLTCRRFYHRPFCVFSPVLSIAACLACYFCVDIVYFQPSECVAQAIARGSCKLQCPLVTTGDVTSGHCSLQLPGALACATRSARFKSSDARNMQTDSSTVNSYEDLLFIAIVDRALCGCVVSSLVHFSLILLRI